MNTKVYKNYQNDKEKIMISKPLLFLLIPLLYCNSFANCIKQEQLTAYEFEVAQKEAHIADIPQYKSGMLLDKTGALENKIVLINAYKKSHMKKPLSPEQVDQINQLEKQRKFFLSEGLCKT
jgi:hypothetical protein